MGTTRAACALRLQLVSKSVRGAVPQPLLAASGEMAILGYVLAGYAAQPLRAAADQGGNCRQCSSRNEPKMRGLVVIVDSM